MSGVLVTGASGYLGGRVTAALIAAGHDVRTLQRRASGVAGVADVLGDVTDAGSRQRALAGVDSVVHLAAKVSFAGDPAEFVRINVEGTRGLLTDARAAGAHRFVFVSSPSVAHTGTSIVGEGAAPAEPERARDDYARTKAAAELVALAVDGPDLAVVAVRPHIVWGPGDPQFVARLRSRRRVPVIGTGAALVDSTYIDDAVSGIIAALDRAEEVHGRPFVITSGEPRPVGELFAAIASAGRPAVEALAVPRSVAWAAGAVAEPLWRFRRRRDDPPMTRFLAEQLTTAHWFDLRSTRAGLRWSPEVGVTEGLRRLAEHEGGGRRPG